jgi:hypothetical protein
MPLDLGPPHWVETAALRPGSTALDAEDALVFPVLDGERVIGAALVGDLGFAVRFAREGEAWALGLDTPTWREEVAVAVWFSTDVDWLAAHPVVSDATGALGWRDDDGWHVVVHAWGLAESERRATAAVRASAAWLAGLGTDPAAMVARDDVRGGTRRELLALETERGPAGRGFLGWARDPTGAIDSGHEEVIFSGDRRVWTTAGSPPGERVSIARGVANASISDGGASHQVAVEALVHLSSPVATATLPLCIPAVASPNLAGLRTTPLIRQEVRWSSNGQPLVDLGPAWGWPAPECEGARDYLLPGPADGVAVAASWSEPWPASHPLEAQEYYAWALRHFGDCPNPVACGGIAGGLRVGTIELGRSTTDHRVLPIQPFQAGAFPVELRVGTTLPSRWNAVIGGSALQPIPRGDARWWVAGDARSDSGIGFGAWTVDEELPLLGFPGIRVASLEGSLGVEPSEVRSILHFYQDALPDWPLAQFAVVEAPARPTALLSGEPQTPTGAAGRGEWAITPLQVIAPDLAGVQRRNAALELSLAEALVAGWWDELAWAREDGWIRDAIVASYVARYAEARGLAFETPPLAAVLLALGQRVGPDTLLRSLERFLAAPGPPTLDRLEATLTADCGGVAADFLESWWVARLAPAVTGTFATDRGRTTVALAADPPLGRYAVPVVVRRGRGLPRTLWVPMVAGAGSATFDGGVESMAIDPARTLPLTDRRLDREPSNPDTRMQSGG